MPGLVPTHRCPPGLFVAQPIRANFQMTNGLVELSSLVLADSTPLSSARIGWKRMYSGCSAQCGECGCFWDTLAALHLEDLVVKAFRSRSDRKLKEREKKSRRSRERYIHTLPWRCGPSYCYYEEEERDACRDWLYST